MNARSLLGSLIIMQLNKKIIVAAYCDGGFKYNDVYLWSNILVEHVQSASKIQTSIFDVSMVILKNYAPKLA